MADESQQYLTQPLLALELAYANRRRARGVEERMLRYGKADSQFIELFLPPKAKAADRLVFYINGGGWSGGNVRGARFVGRFFAEAGYPTAVCGYRPAPQSLFPAQLEDLFDGLAAVLEFAEEQGLHLTSVVAGGYGSGGQLAALLALDRAQQVRHCIASETFSGLLLLGALLDLSVCRDEKACRDLKALMGGRRGWDAADPMRHVRGDEDLAVLIVHGAEDAVAPPDAARAFAMNVNAGREDGPARLVMVPGVHHNDLQRLFFERRAETDAVLSWLEQDTRKREELAPRPEFCLVPEPIPEPTDISASR